MLSTVDVSFSNSLIHNFKYFSTILTLYNSVLELFYFTFKFEKLFKTVTMFYIIKKAK